MVRGQRFRPPKHNRVYQTWDKALGQVSKTLLSPILENLFSKFSKMGQLSTFKSGENNSLACLYFIMCVYTENRGHRRQHTVEYTLS